MKIYIVFGQTGEYSDHTEWTVKAFIDENKAKELVENATKEAKTIEVTHERYYYPEKGENKYDPNMKMDYTGTIYYIEEVELES